MRVILLTDVAKVGKRHEVKEVNDGYAKNFLIARKLAEPATPSAMARLEGSRKAQEKERETQRDNILKAVGVFRETPLSIEAKATPEGHLFAGITREKIAELATKNAGTTFSPDMLLLEKPIKGVGVHEIPLQVGGAKATLLVDVRPTA